jgi:sulfopyruvate decarboxylase TPP-binding subunit
MRSIQPRTEPEVRDCLARHGIDLVLAVPCKYVANLLNEVAEDAP